MSAPETVITMLPPFVDVAVIVFATMVLTAWTVLIVDVGLTPRKSFETTLNGTVRFAELILTLPVTVTGKVSLTPTGDAASEPPTNVVCGSTVSVKVTPVASSPVAAMPTVYFNVSPGSALPSISLSTSNRSVLVAVIVGTKGVSGARDTDDLFGFEATGCFWSFGATSLLLRAGSGRALLDSTEIEKATADT